MIRSKHLLLLVSVWGSMALAQDEAPSGGRRGGAPSWSAASAKTLGSGTTALYFQAGYPGISAAILAGQSAKFDLGGRFSFLYGAEYITNIAPGLRLQGILRFLLGQNGRMRAGLEFEPGLYTYFNRFGGATFGIFLPLKFTIAFFVIPELAVHAGIDLPLAFNVISSFFAAIPILMGGGMEYFATPNVSLTLRLRFGPSIIATQPGAFVTLGLDALFGVALRL
ncbi:MAG: hypothetical protein ACKVPX_16970 [Myxococcaceae bacterium]